MNERAATETSDRKRDSDGPPRSGSDLRPGDVIGGLYRIEAVLGQGASGIVHLSRTLDGEELVALKVIHRELCGDKQIFGRYKREASILSRLDHQNIVGIRAFIEHQGLLVIVLDYVNGASLESVLLKQLTVDQAIEVALQIVAGLESAHLAGVIHRDLKPANIMIEPPGFPASSGVPRVRILDFGLAKVLHGEQMTTGLTEHDMIFGTAEYMAPEQARGDELDQRCDVYAVGIMLYEMVTGSVPFSCRTPLATMTAQLAEEVKPPRSIAPSREISPALEAVILRALSKERDDRYVSARALGDALEAVSEKRVVSVVPLRSGESLRSSSGAPATAQELELGETDLAIRLSQVPAERRAAFDSRAPRPSSPSQSHPSSPPSEDSAMPASWKIAAAIIALVAIVAGVLLAMR